MRVPTPRTGRKTASVAVGLLALAVTMGGSLLSPAGALGPDPGNRQTKPSATGSAPAGVRLSDADAAAVTLLSESTLRAPNRAPFTDITAGQALVVPRATDPAIILVQQVALEDDGNLLLSGDPLTLLELAGQVGADLRWNSKDIFAAADTDTSGKKADPVGFDSGDQRLFSLTVPFDDSLPGESYSSMRGEVTIAASARLKFGVEAGVMPMRVNATAEATVTAEIEAKGQFGAGYNGDVTLDLMPEGTTLPPLPCQPLPLALGLVCPTVNPILKLEADVSAGGQVSLSYKPTAGAKVSVDDGMPTVDGTVKTDSSVTKKQWELYGAGSFKGAFLADVQFHYATPTGPYIGVEVGPYFKFSADTSADPWWVGSAGLQAGFTYGGSSWVNVGGASPVVEVGPEIVLGQASPSLFPGVRTTPSLVQLARGETQTLSVDTSGHVGSATYAWKVIGKDGGTLSRSTGTSVTYTPPDRAGSYTIEVTSSEATKPGTVLVTVLPDPPSKPTKVTASPGLRLANVAFAVGDDGGDAIDQIQIRRSDQPGTEYTYAFGGPYRYVGLPAKEPHRVQVRLHNKGGWSPWSAPSNEVTPYGPIVMKTPKRFLPDVAHFDLSADARTLAYLDADPNGTAYAPVMVKNTTTGKVTTASIVNGEPYNVSEDRFAMDPSGRYVAFASQDQIWVRDIREKVTRNWHAKCEQSLYYYPEDLDFARGALSYSCGNDQTSPLYVATRNGKKHIKVSERSDTYEGRSNMLSASGDVLLWMEMAPEMDRNGDGKIDYRDDAWELARRDFAAGTVTRYPIPSRSTSVGTGSHDALALSADGSTFAVTYVNTDGVIYTGRFDKAGHVNDATFRAIALSDFSGYDHNLALSENGGTLAFFNGSNGYSRNARLTFYDGRSGEITRQDVCRYYANDTYPDNAYTWGAHVHIRNRKVYFGCSGADEATPAMGLYRASMVERAG